MSRPTWTDRVASFRYAFRGLGAMLRSEPNARIHLVATVAVVAAGWALDVEREGWLWLVVAMAGVWVSEAFNTALERLADVVSPEPHPGIRDAKDIAAAAVLIATLAAVIIGGVVLGPPLLGWMTGCG